MRKELLLSGRHVTLDGDGEVDLAVTARIRNGWMMFRMLLPFLTFRAPPVEMKGETVYQLSQK